MEITEAHIVGPHWHEPFGAPANPARIRQKSFRLNCVGRWSRSARSPPQLICHEIAAHPKGGANAGEEHAAHQKHEFDGPLHGPSFPVPAKSATGDISFSGEESGVFG